MWPFIFSFYETDLTAEFRIPFLSNFQHPITIIASSGLRASFFLHWNTSSCVWIPPGGWCRLTFVCFVFFFKALLQTDPICKEIYQISVNTQKTWEAVLVSFSCRVSGTCPPAQQPQWARFSSLPMLHDHPQTHRNRPDSSGRVISPTQTPLPDNTQHSQQTTMSLPGFKPPIPARERPQTRALDRTATGFDIVAKYRQ